MHVLLFQMLLAKGALGFKLLLIFRGWLLMHGRHYITYAHAANGVTASAQHKRHSVVFEVWSLLSTSNWRQ